MKSTGTQRLRVLAVLFIMMTTAVMVHAQTYTMLYNFPETDRNNTGIFSQLMAQGRDGNLYGTIATGGAHKGGSAYKMTTSGQFTTIYDFCALTSCADGSGPMGGLTLGFDGNLYGTTNTGGSHAAGTVFKLTPNGQLTTLWNFDNGDGGGVPSFTLVQGQDNNLYGVSSNQYAGHYGAFFKISPSGVFTPLYQWDYTHGNGPNLPTQGTDGTLYGTTVAGGAHNLGVVYKLTTSGTITVLHDFAGGTTDGATPVGILVQGNDSSLYGMTYRGGTKNVGTVFKISTSGSFTLLYSFAGYNTDGALPYTGLTLGTDGNFYGSTANGGTKNAGMLFKITSAGVETKLYNFCDPTCNGYYPEAPLVQHTNGRFYGLTTGNSLGGGVFYSLDMGLKPLVDLVNWQGKVGATVEILGQSFTGTTQVSFNGTIATFNNLSDTYMTATVPAGATTGLVTVTTFTNTMKSNRKFLVIPQVLSFSSDHGVVGDQVTITGASFTQAQGVGFGDSIPAQFTVDSDTQITATLPPGAKTGPVGVKTPGGTGISSQKFTVLPKITGFSPTSGPVGTPVKIGGYSFKGATKVTFGGVVATSFQVIKDTEVDALVPSGAVTGPISVTTASGTGTSTGNFTVTP